MEKAPDKRKALGKGLSALLPSRQPGSAAPVNGPAPEAPAAKTGQIPIHLIDPNPLQPRHSFDETRLEELAASIRVNGIIQPLIVRRKRDRYELVAGERRLRAARLANLTEIPALVQDYADELLLQLALIENIQREDLNPIETAQALERLSRELNLSHEELGRRTGKERTTITNLLRLLRLPDQVQLQVAENRLSMGHAKALLSLPTAESQTKVAQMVVEEDYSVRALEGLIQRLKNPPDVPKTVKKSAPAPDPNVSSAVRELEAALGTRVRIREKTPERGTIEIEYYSQEDLNRIYELLMGNGAGGRS
jgi:ParB family chromosome partitioning protein